MVTLMPFMLFALLPAILIAQDRNGIHTILCPEFISSSKVAVYFLIWGFPTIVMLITRLEFGWNIFKCPMKYDTEKIAILLWANLMAPFVLWLSITQILIHFNGTFRTEIGLLLSWPGTIAAFAMVVLSSLALIFVIMYDIASALGFG